MKSHAQYPLSPVPKLLALDSEGGCQRPSCGSAEFRCCKLGFLLGDVGWVATPVDHESVRALTGGKS